MITFGPLTRALALAGLLVSAFAAIGATIDAPADVALLKFYI